MPGVRYDKYSGVTGGFRVPLGQAIDAEDSAKMLGVGINGAGRGIVGSSNSGVKGVYVADRAKNLLEVADVMTDGEIVGDIEFNPGDNLYAGADGEISTTNTGVYVGVVVADQSTTGGAPVKRVVVRVAR